MNNLLYNRINRNKINNDNRYVDIISVIISNIIISVMGIDTHIIKALRIKATQSFLLSWLIFLLFPIFPLLYICMYSYKHVCGFQWRCRYCCVCSIYHWRTGKKSKSMSIKMNGIMFADNEWGVTRRGELLKEADTFSTARYAWWRWFCADVQSCEE